MGGEEGQKSRRMDGPLLSCNLKHTLKVILVLLGERQRFYLQK